HEVPAAAGAQVAVQQSQSSWFPSSQLSPGSTTPLPHRVPVRLSKNGHELHTNDDEKVLPSAATTPSNSRSGQVSPNTVVRVPAMLNAPEISSKLPLAW